MLYPVFEQEYFSPGTDNNLLAKSSSKKSFCEISVKSRPIDSKKPAECVNNWCIVMPCLSIGTFMKNLLNESVNFSCPNSTSFKMAVLVNCLVLDPMSKIVFGLLRVLLSLFAKPQPLFIINSPSLIARIAPEKPLVVP